MEKFKIKSEEINKLLKEREIEKINENKKKKSNQKKRNNKKSFIYLFLSLKYFFQSSL